MDSERGKQSRKAAGCGLSENIELLARAMECWDNLAGFRSDRERNKRFTYGDQWGRHNRCWRRADAGGGIYPQPGNVPLKNNMIRRLVRNVLGVFRNRYSVPSCEG